MRRLRAALVPADTVTTLAETFRALGDPTRVRILDVLSHGELCVCDLAAVLSLSQSAVSHQLRLLRGLRLVRARREGRMVFYALDDRHVGRSARRGAEARRRAVARPARRRAPAEAAERQMKAEAHVVGECCTHCAPEPPRSTAAQARGVLAAIAAVLLTAGCLSELAGGAPAWTQPLFLVAVVAGAVFPARRAWTALRRGALDINVLMVIAVAGALAIGEWEEAAVVVFLFSVAQWLESQSIDRAREAIRTLLDLAPIEARIEDHGIRAAGAARSRAARRR